MSAVTPSQSFQHAVGGSLHRRSVTTVQINVGKWCNQACLHCHVEAGPNRTERMEEATARRILALLENSPSVECVDITGGAPELNPNFRLLVEGARARGLHVMDRCNLTVLQEPGQNNTAQFLADHDVEVIASLPCYSEANVERQRGRGVFARSIEGLRTLNALGYGKPGSGRTLSLVYNPGGPHLPPAQAALESDYRKRLFEDFGVQFTRLFTLTNMPIARFRWDLERSGSLASYMGLLREAFNAQASASVMCRSLVSVGWDGRLFDCDFNQMLEMPYAGSGKTLWDVHSFDELSNDPIALDDHCFGCTAGAGSSCGGALV